MNKDNLVRQWDEYVESMGSVMGEVEHVAQQMRDRIEDLEAKLAEAEAQNKKLGDMYHKRGNDLAWTQRQLKKAEAKLTEVEAERDRWSIRADSYIIRAEAAEAKLAQAEMKGQNDE